MEANFKIDDVYRVYRQLFDDEQQECDLCRDWNLEECEKCELVSRFVSNLKKGETMSIILYTIDCPNCIILEKKLRAKNIEFIRVSDEDTIRAKGYGDLSFPILEVNGVVMSYRTAIQWINNQ